MNYQKANEFIDKFHIVTSKSLNTEAFNKWLFSSIRERTLIRVLNQYCTELLPAAERLIEVDVSHKSYLETQIDSWYDWVGMLQDGLYNLDFSAEMKELLDRSIKRMYAAIYAVEEKIQSYGIQNLEEDNEFIDIDSSIWGDDPTWLVRLCGYRNRVTSTTEWRREKLLKALEFVEKRIVISFLQWMIERNLHRAYMVAARARWSDDIYWLNSID